jgi:hypothetical protein
MKKKKHSSDDFVWILLILVVLILIVVFVWNYLFLEGGNIFTGKATDLGFANVTIASSAGIQVTGGIVIGSGYFNATCNSTASNIDSNHTYDGNYLNLTLWNATNPAIFPYCWINTSAIFSGGLNNFTLINNGSALINVSVIGNYDGEDWMCGGSCSLTENAAAGILSYNSEGSSCGTGLTSSYESLNGADANNTVGLCDSLDYVDTSDSIKVYMNITIPKDATSGVHNLNLTFQGIAV